MTVEEFGRSIKQKYPQYNSYSDADIGQRMIDKYPEYRSRVNQQITPENTIKAQQRGFGGIVSGIAKDALQTLVVKPGVRIGQATAYGIASLTGNESAKQRALGDQSVSVPGLGTYDIAAQQGGSAGFKQIGSDALKSATYLAPVGKVGGAVAKLGESATAKTALRFGGNVLEGAAQGYAADVAGNLDANKSGGEVFKPGLGTGVGTAFPVVGQVGGAILKRIAGFNTGAGTSVIQRAIDNPNEVNAAIKKYAANPEAKQQIVSSVEDVLNGLVKERNSAYAEGLNNLVTNHPNTLKANELANQINVLNEKYVQKPTAANKKALEQATQTYQTLVSGSDMQKDSVINSFVKHVKEFGGQIDQNGELTFKNSKLTRGDRTDLTDAWSDLREWTDVTPQGFDALRQNIAGYMDKFKLAGNSRANVILGNVKRELTNEMESKIPGYRKLLSNYGEQSAAIEALKADLLTNSKSPTSQLSKVMKIFKKDPSVVQLLTEQMGEKEANKLLNDISGAVLSSWVPEGKLMPFLKGAAESGLALGTAAVSGLGPAAAVGAAGLATASPRLVGKTAVTAGKVAKSGVPKVLKKAATIGAAKKSD